MNPLFIIPVVLVIAIAGIVFMVIMNKRYKSAKTEINIDQERGNYSSYKNELLNQDFSFLKNWMDGKVIDAFSSASIPQSTANKVQNLIGDGLKNVALSSVGVRLRRIETDAFWVLSGKDLHFFTTDTAGELEEHLIFDNFRIEKAQLRDGGLLKAQLGFYAKQAEEYLPKVHVITFDIDGQQLSLEIHDRLRYVVNPTDILNLKKQLQIRAKYQVVGEQLVEELKSRFSNLRSV
ncbi:hypothetical protein SAMN05518672_10899 [Chitinophaga sp. CF118]|uniref:hypothetical protein n=1 Tax=Chitinophaga sp. CF118 TaxID=1884367 RepID=UPI0008E6D37B|nr:hypothetical protein [Chitinophaga sp. CF118]SFE61208.1 hypothetical protein SAMN05518672_10899 [Chitinophaga sp. CF118]